jgi:RNA polymerase sigma factor (TIGR02999 family)
MADDNTTITDALKNWSNRGREGFAEALPVLYPELRKAAESLLGSKRSDLTLGPETLAQKLSLELASLTHASWENRRRFFAFAKLKMGHILSDHAERKKAQKRGGGQWQRDEAEDLNKLAAGGFDFEEKELEHFLSELFATDKVTYNVVVLRVAGFTNDEIAAALAVSPSTIDRHVDLARRALALILRAR